MESIDEQIKQEIFFEKYKYMSIEDFENIMKDSYNSLIGKITGRDNWNQNRIFKLINELEKEWDSIYANTEKSALNEIHAVTASFVLSESKLLKQKFSEKLVDQVFNPENDYVLGYTFNDLFSTSNEAAKKRTRRILSKNLLEGNNPKQYVNELYNSNVLLTKKQLLTSTRTYAKNLREKVKDETERQSKGMTGWYSLATLDSRTTPICIKLDKEFYPKKEYRSRMDIPDKPPRHFNCRSILVRGFSDTFSFDRAAKGDEKRGTQVDARTTFNSFLERNPKTALKLMGPKKYDLYKSGKYNIKDFIADDGRWFTLEELERELH